MNLKSLLTITIAILSFNLLAQTESEPNDNSVQANQINLNQSISAFIGEDKDQDYFKFEIESPNQVHVQVTKVPSNIELEVFLYDPNFNVIWADYSKSDGEIYDFWFSTCQIGIFHISFRDGETLSHAGGSDFNIDDDYKFMISATSLLDIDGSECNNSFNTARTIEPCLAIHASINPWFLFYDQVTNDEANYDIDYFKIELKAEESIRIEVDSVPNEIALCLTIYDEWQQKLEYYSGDYGQTMDLAFTAQENGIYYIKIQDCKNNFSIDNQYILQVGCNFISSTYYSINPSNLAVYPNPFIDNLNLQFENYVGEKAEIKIFDVSGHSVLQEVRVIAKKLNISADTLPKGLLILQIKIGDRKLSKKIFKN